MKPEFNREKFKAVVHYLCSRGDSDFGRIKLHKALYFADMLHFIDSARPLTGVDYVKQQYGPTARYLKWALDELEKDGKLAVDRQDYFGFPKDRFRTLRQPATNLLSENETRLLDDTLRFIGNYSATAISELSHNEAWHAFGIGDVIPYETAYWLVPTEVSDDDLQWAAAQMNQHAA